MDHPSEIEAVFQEVLALPPNKRPAFLNRLRATDPTLHAELTSLLDAYDDADGFFKRLSDTFVSPVYSTIGDKPSPPTQVGAYRIVREVGHGGMSTVYLAERADGHFEHRVALKLVRSGVDDAGRRKHFRSERQILASLNHPNVARLFDGGVTDDGSPYLVMEYVEGEPIDRYCDARCLSLNDRLRLFQVVVRAVQYAHSNLVIHRDLKPSNILVATPVSGQPNRGQVKLLDFGIAKLLDAEDNDPDASTTQTRSRWMTPEYAAPEQIKGERVTTATDIYQLGVVLYRLLTGHRPYRVDTTSTYAIEQAVCEKEPTRPSTVVGKIEEVQRGDATTRITPEAVSQTRATELHALQRTLSGDLDAILLKALRKEPEQRYATAEAFSEDIRRYLEGKPVRARRGSLSYRAAKYIRRNRWGVAAVVAIVLLLIGYAVTVTLQQQQVARERDRARIEAAKATQITDFLFDLFESADPEVANIDSISARQLVDQGARHILALNDQPQAQALLMAAIGQVYEKSGLYEESVHLLDSSLALRRRVLQPPHPDLAEGHYLLANALVNTGRYQEAEGHLRDAFAMWDRLPESEARRARGLVLLAALWEREGNFAGADSLNQQALALQHNTLGDQHPDVAQTLNKLASLRRDRGDYAGADSLYHQALAMQRALLGENHLDVAATLNNLAALRFTEGAYAPADSLYEQALTILRRTLGEAHPDLARVLNNAGILRQRMGNLASAEALLRQSLAIRRRFLPPAHAGMAVAYYNLAGVLQDQGDFAAAESLYRQTLAIDRNIYGDDHAEVALDLSKLASVLHTTGQSQEAESLYQQALATGRRTLPPDHPRLAGILTGYGRLLVDRRRAAEAEVVLAEALRIRDAADADRDTAETRLIMGRCLTLLDRFDEAEPLLVPTYDTLAVHLGRDAPATRQARAALIALYEAWNKPEQAERYQRMEPDP